jgi:hypothetical protein
MTKAVTDKKQNTVSQDQIWEIAISGSAHYWYIQERLSDSEVIATKHSRFSDAKPDVIDDDITHTLNQKFFLNNGVLVKAARAGRWGSHVDISTIPAEELELA